ncbi:MAG: NUDIX hydrolase [Candidatus Levybacteria bacterium CG_4_9_14_3_um_filter_35_16]|nr:MAG: NUDIX hydrolase [Candidatus Levybacteria bacterium CG22_combo_CG10-13_8_21_14_all_35_11]PIY93917.1 MAG: NUDIX hydrolase [Candidatus Levybacteria bacterium CG_4_10_14_0_8_um_filter_35_23]PJA91117.1 MAG: NUDIX hydrolase [Candidatus Levybacteria bacterium CG_4_9_14_3_um_filter_35_16]PJC54493.1 MAG: NUDIX hydrolase [Candidatus Levybacteria bacterium CG_4_9_14_0_2_um_filter_35_21]
MKFEFSAGGVVIRQVKSKKLKVKSGIEVLVCQHSQHHGWVFPKGLIGDNVKGEGKEETAVREVKEETGIEAKILKPLDPVVYWYVLDGIKIRKTVYYYVMEFISGDFSKRDMEMENVEWLPVDKVEEKLTYKSDKKVWQEAKKYLPLASSN